MKNIIIYTILVTALSTVSCEKWLDVPSKTEVTETDMFRDEEGFFDALSGAYYLMTDAGLYGDALSMSFLDILAGRYELNGNYNITASTTYKDYYGTSVYYLSPSINPIINKIWSNGYNAIANINNLLGAIDEQQNVFSEDNYELVKGEALGLRAFLHFDLLRMFGTSYLADPEAASIPYVTEFSGKKVTALYKVSEVLDSVIYDLSQAEILLEQDDINGESQENIWFNDREQHFNNLAVCATLARAYLYKGDKDNALKYALKVINADKLRFTTSAELNQTGNGSYSFNYAPEHIFALAKYDLNALFDLKPYFTSSNFSLTLGTTTTNDGPFERLFEVSTNGGDFRYEYGLNVTQPNQNNVDIIYRFTKKYTQVNSSSPNRIPIIRLPEMYYIAAESLGVNEGLPYLNTVRTARGLTELSENLDEATYQNEIYKEYAKEFYAEGQLFYYYKRRNEQYIVYFDQTIYFNAYNMGYVFPIPEEELIFER